MSEISYLYFSLFPCNFNLWIKRGIFMKSHCRKIYSIVLVLTLIFVSPFINLFTTQTIAATIEIDDWYVTTNSARRFYLWNTILCSCSYYSHTNF